MPSTLNVEFKRPTLLPNSLTLSAAPAGQDFASASSSTGGDKWQAVDQKGRLTLQGCLTCSLA